MTVTLLCGLAFAGKSTLASAMARRLGVTVVSPDEINAARGLHGGTGIPVAAPLDVALQRLRSNEQTRPRPAVTESVMRQLAETFEHPSIDEATLVFHSGEDPDRWVEEHRSRLRSAV